MLEHLQRVLYGGLPAALACLALAHPSSAAGVGDAANPDAAYVRLSNELTVSRWAYPQRTALVRGSASAHAGVVGRLHFLTEDGRRAPPVLGELTRPSSGPGAGTWLHIAVPRRPNGVTGWVPRGALGALHVVYGHLLLNRERLRATLFDGRGRAIWSAPIGVGRPSLPTPAGHFYVREKLRAVDDPLYGRYAIGTSAYSEKLTEWPGGGVVGIHGTDEPGRYPAVLLTAASGCAIPTCTGCGSRCVRARRSPSCERHRSRRRQACNWPHRGYGVMVLNEPARPRRLPTFGH